MTDIQFYMAPVQGYTDCTWRYFHHQIFNNIVSYYTPFMRVERGKLRNKDLYDINPDNNEGTPVIPQIIACEPQNLEIMLDKLSEWNYSEIDINLGCPFPLIARHHKGSGMLKYPKEVETLCATLLKYRHLQYSFKMRIGYESADEWKEVLSILESISPKHITVHPRVATQQYRGEINWDAFSQIYECTKVPLIYNGDVTTHEQIEELHRKFPKLKGIMIGRKILENPAFLREGDTSATLYKQFHDNLFEAYSARLKGGDAQLLMKMKTLWEYFLASVDKKLIKAIKKSSNLKKYEIATDALWNSL